MLLSLSSLTPNACQPPIRTEEAAMRGLIEEIKESEYIAPISVVEANGTYVIADGHRRARAAEALEYSKIPAVLMPPGTDPVEAFIRLNKASRRVNGREWLTVWAYDPSQLSRLPNSAKSNIKALIGWVGKPELTRIGRDGQQSHDIAKAVSRVLNTLQNYPALKSRVTGSDVFYWIVEHQQQRALIEHFKKSYRPQDAKRLLSCIRRNRGLE